MTVQFEIIKKDVLLQVKTEAFVTGEANKDGELSRINHATKTQASDDDDDILNEYINTAASAITDLLSGHLSPSQPADQKEKFIFTRYESEPGYHKRHQRLYVGLYSIQMV